MDILQTVPFDKLDITTLSVEYYHLSVENGDHMIKFMENKGYNLHSKVNADYPTWVRDNSWVV